MRTIRSENVRRPVPGAASSRRSFLQRSVGSGVLLGLGDLTFLSRLTSVSAAEARPDPGHVIFDAAIEPLVRLLETTPRERLLEEVAFRVRHGVNYRDLVAALLLAGVRNIQPRPVGYKFHAVLVVNSAHLASVSSPDSDRWLPIFWALDYFKDAQAQDVREGDWTMASVEESSVPPSHRARESFVDAMDRWDEAAADAAVVGLARSAGAQELFEIFCRYGARDFRDIGHKAIYVTNSWRTLQCVGWQHAEPVLRSLAYALLAHEGGNPATRDAAADRPWRRNLELAKEIRRDWLDARDVPEEDPALLGALRTAGPQDACAEAVALLNEGVGPQAVWDACFAAAIELLMGRPDIVSLHAVTSTNALHYAFQHVGDDETRRLLLLQTVAFLTLFRGEPSAGGSRRIDAMRAAEGGAVPGEPLAEIFDRVGGDPGEAARLTLGFLAGGGHPQAFIDAARRLVFLKGTNSHDYKYSSAVLEDYYQISPRWRDRFLAGSVYKLRGATGPDNGLVQRTRAALAGA